MTDQPYKKLPYLILTLAVLLSVGFAGQAFAIQPQVRNVVPYNVGGSTFLNVTVYHYPEDASIPHYVDKIEVTMGGNTTDMSIGVQTLSADNTFNVTYNLGPISGTPTITVRAHCIVNGWSTPYDWTGTVPEFPVPMLLIALALCASGVVYASRKMKTHAQA
jgi:hypothetical protein